MRSLHVQEAAEKLTVSMPNVRPAGFVESKRPDIEKHTHIEGPTRTIACGLCEIDHARKYVEHQSSSFEHTI